MIKNKELLKILNSGGGQTMIEVLVALGTAVVVISAITVSVITSLKNSQFSKNQNLATQYAQGGMEIVRQIRNSEYSVFNSLEDKKYYCLDKGASTLREEPVDEGCLQNVDVFIRKVYIEKNSSECEPIMPPNPTPTPILSTKPTKIKVLVQWSDSQCTDPQAAFCHKVEISSCFSDFTVISPP